MTNNALNIQRSDTFMAKPQAAGGNKALALCWMHEVEEEFYRERRKGPRIDPVPVRRIGRTAFTLLERRGFPEHQMR